MQYIDETKLCDTNGILTDERRKLKMKMESGQYNEDWWLPK